VSFRKPLIERNKWGDLVNPANARPKIAGAGHDGPTLE
jgi:hypothetical protein